MTRHAAHVQAMNALRIARLLRERLQCLRCYKCCDHPPRAKRGLAARCKDGTECIGLQFLKNIPQ
jgi:hypothetical protein